MTNRAKGFIVLISALGIAGSMVFIQSGAPGKGPLTVADDDDSAAGDDDDSAKYLNLPLAPKK